MATVIMHPAESGTYLPLVLLAPFPLDSRVWAPVAEMLGGNVVTVDPPGFGGEIDGDPSIDGYARAVLAELDARGVERFLVAGNSMGGYVAMALAELAPERIAALGLFGTKASADTDEARAGRIAMAERAEAGAPASELVGPMIDKLIGPSVREHRPDAEATLASWLAEAPASGIAWAQRAMAGRPDRTQALKDLRAPGVVVYGVEDPLMPPAEQRVMAGALGLLIELPCGHLVPFELPDAAARILADLWNLVR